MYITQKEIWDRNAKEYIKSVKEDKTGVFAYEEVVNTPSLLNLFLNSAKNVLDLGCGDGRFLSILTSRFDHVVSVDISSEMIKIAKARAPRAKYIEFDLDKDFPDFNYKFDLITAQLTLMYINDLNRLASCCNYALQKGGAILISVTHPLSWFFKSLKARYERNVDFDPFFHSYFSEIRVIDTIAENPNINFTFIHRTFETYVNTFTANGFLLESISEPVVPSSFLIKYPQYQEKARRPLRLNLKFIKK